MSKTVKLEVQDTGNATANMILLFNEFLQYGKDKAGLSPTGVGRLIDVFKEDSKGATEL